MPCRIATLLLILAVVAMPLHAQQEDEMGRLVQPRVFSDGVVAQVRAEQTQADPWTTALLYTGAGLGLAMLTGGLVWWWAGSNPRVRRLVAATGALKVLSRMHFGMRHQVLVLKVGSRALVVGISPQGMRTLSEINDPREVAKLEGGAVPALAKVEPVTGPKIVATPRAERRVPQPRPKRLQAEVAKLQETVTA